MQKAGISFIFEREQSSALLRLLELNVRVILLDITSKELNGVNLLNLVKKLRPRVPIIAVIERHDELFEQSLYDSGAMFCISKETSDENVQSLIFRLWE